MRWVTPRACASRSHKANPPYGTVFYRIVIASPLKSAFAIRPVW
jgi:hypothetical protein